MKKASIKSINFHVSGKGNATHKLTLPKKWVEDMEITKDEREVILKYNEETKTITIQKFELE